MIRRGTVIVHNTHAGIAHHFAYGSETTRKVYILRIHKKTFVKEPNLP